MTRAPDWEGAREGEVGNIEAYIGWGAGFWTAGALQVDTDPMRSNPAAPIPRAAPITGEGDAACAEGRRAAAAAALPFLTPAGAIDPAKPPKGIVVEGLESPWMLERVYQSTGALADGYAPPIFVVEPDAEAARRSLRAAPLDHVLNDPRVKLFSGAEAASAFETHLLGRLDYALPDFLVQTPSGSPRGQHVGTAEVVRRAHIAQQALHSELDARVRKIYSARDEVYWGNRFKAGIAAARSGGGRPLRVLLPISRYSTVVRHSAADLAAAIRAQGHEAELLTEPDDHSRLVTVAYLRQFADWQPDMVVLINYTRRHMGQAVPPGVPFVCWVQDRMPQLFDEAIGRSQGPMDFLIGHLHVEMFSQFGYPKVDQRGLFRFVPASAKTFHVGDSEASERPCDIAYISHQSETAEATRARLAPAFAAHPAIARAVDRIFAELSDRIGSGGAFDPIEHLRTPTVSAALAAEGVASPDPRLVGAILSNFAVPIAERLWRHSTLEWASRIADRRGWRLGIYGNGWERHPSLARFARAALPHDDALRQVYHASGACLHASLTTNAHQRVFECALSGGIMLRRGPSPDREVGAHALRHFLLRCCKPLERRADGVWRWEINAGGELDPDTLYRVAGFPEMACGVWTKKMSAEQRAHSASVWPIVDIRDLPDYAFPRASETLFETEAQLEAMLERAIDDTQWRAETATAHRAAALQRHTYDSLARDLMGMVSAALAGSNEVAA